MSKMKFQAPNAGSLKSTGIFAGSAGAGYLGARAAHNFFPSLSAPTTKNIAIVAAILLGSLAAHASVKGTDTASEVVRGVTAGVAVHSFGKVANMAGQRMNSEPAPAQQGVTGLKGLKAPAFAKAFLCDHYPMRVPSKSGLNGKLREIMLDATLENKPDPQDPLRTSPLLSASGDAATRLTV